MTSTTPGWSATAQLFRGPTQAAHPDNLASLEVLTDQLTAFETRYNQAARPFDWRFNSNDLDRLLHRIAA